MNLKRKIVKIKKSIGRYKAKYFYVKAFNFFYLLFNAPKYILKKIKNSKKLRRRIVVPGFVYKFMPPPNKVRRYINPKIGIENTFKTLSGLNVNYLILRWFDDLPSWPENEDIDILIEDSDLTKIRPCFVRHPKKIPVDVYTVSAKRGWNGLPYYPPKLAKQMLDSKQSFRQYYFVPDTLSHLLSLVYHIVFHKAEKSGLRINAVESNENSGEHDYETIIRDLAGKNNIQVEPTLEGLFDLLKAKGWLPANDTLRKYSIYSPWLRNKTQHNRKNMNDGEMCVFVVREWVLKNGEMEFVIRWFHERVRYFDIVKIIYLNAREQERAVHHIRGGEWGKGPFPVSGGLPAALLVCFDYHPVLLEEKRRKKYPFIENKHVLLKEKLRDEINSNLLRTKRVNSLHSSDNEKEGWEYLKNVLDENSFQTIAQEITQRREAYTTVHPVLHMIKTSKTRAKLEIIRYNGSFAVKKTFKWGCKEYLRREVFAYKELSKTISMIPPILEEGSSYVIYPYYENILQGKKEKEIKGILKHYSGRIIQFIKSLYDSGYFLIDFHYGNIILTEEKEIKIVDFEFLYRYEDRPKTFREAFEICGVPKGLSIDLPKGHKSNFNYRKRWKGIIKEGWNCIGQKV